MIRVKSKKEGKVWTQMYGYLINVNPPWRAEVWWPGRTPSAVRGGRGGDLLVAQRLFGESMIGPMRVKRWGLKCKKTLSKLTNISLKI